MCALKLLKKDNLVYPKFPHFPTMSILLSTDNNIVFKELL